MPFCSSLLGGPHVAAEQPDRSRPVLRAAGPHSGPPRVYQEDPKDSAGRSRPCAPQNREFETWVQFAAFRSTSSTFVSRRQTFAKTDHFIVCSIFRASPNKT